MKIIKSLAFLLIIISLASCKKDEGTGGRSSISGKVYNSDYSPNFANIIDSYYMPDADVYIIYGDDETFSDKVSTNYDGTFRFEYLREGDYTIFVYSEDSTLSSTSDMTAIKKSFFLENKEDKDIGTLNIVNETDYDDGAATISGKVYKINYNADYTIINEEYYSGDEDVYIVYGNDLTYFDKTKTSADGSYSFTNLIKGDYRVYVFSEDLTQQTVSNLIEVSKDTTIVTNNQNIVLDDLIIID